MVRRVTRRGEHQSNTFSLSQTFDRRTRRGAHAALPFLASSVLHTHKHTHTRTNHSKITSMHPKASIPMTSETPLQRKRANTSSDQPPRVKRPRSAPDDTFLPTRRGKRAHSFDQPQRPKRARIAPEDYFMPIATDSLGDSHPESIQLRLDKVSDSVKEAGYNSIFHAALEAARCATTSDRKDSGRRELREFVNSGELNELYNLSHSVRHINRLPPEEKVLHTQLVTDPAAQIFKKEWNVLTKCHALRISLSEFNPGFISSFSFDDLYETVQKCAPTLVSLLESFNPDLSPEAVESRQTAIRRRRRRALTSITALLAGSSLTTVQTFVTYYLYASRVPKRVFNILNSLGISSSYTTLMRIVDQQAKEVRRILKGVAARGQAIQISFDNINWQNDVRYMRLHNWVSVGSGIAGYVLIAAKFTPMFPRSAVNYDAAKDLTLRDFLPSEADQNILLEAFRSSFFEVVKSFTKSLKLPAPTVDIPSPTVSPLDSTLRPEIHTLPLYDLNETLMDEMIQVLYRIQKDIGLSEEQVQKNIILFKGDLLTIINTRSPFSE